MNIRGAVTFAILMANGEGILNKSPSYLLEKLRTCEGYSIPEVILDSNNRAIFDEYAKKFGFSWKKEDAWNLPRNQFDPVTGEPLIIKEE